jgi:hypothetical protein
MITAMRWPQGVCKDMATAVYADHVRGKHSEVHDEYGRRGHSAVPDAA